MSADLEAARDRFTRALAAHVEQRLDDAERDYRAALALAPDRPSIVFNLGRLLLDRERDAEAEPLFRQALELAPRDHEAAYNLGLAVARQERFAEALEHYERALALEAGFAEAHAARGAALAKLGREADALASHARAIELRPHEAAFQAGFAASAAAGVAEPSPVVERALVACLEGANVDDQLLGPLAWSILRTRFDGFRATPALERLAADRLLLLALERITVGEGDAEAFFTAVRRELLNRVAENPAGSVRLEPLAVALAQQCFRNEYVWDESDAERALAGALAARVRDAIAAGAPVSAGPPRAIELAALGCYEALHRDGAIREWGMRHAGGGSEGLRAVLRTQIAEPAAEAALAAKVRRLGTIRDPVSRAVKAQYEENPYPRWFGLARPAAMPCTRRILREIAPYAPALEPEIDAPRILIAGCGTGRHAIVYATAYRGARVVALDLSAASLGYAARKCAALGVGNVEFVLGDILDVDERLGAFDVISSIGVLHHMADPLAGLARLVSVLKPSGYLMLGLYSELARRDIVRIRSLVAERGLDSSVAGIRTSRRRVRCAGGRSRRLLRHLDGPRPPVPRAGAPVHDPAARRCARAPRARVPRFHVRRPGGEARLRAGVPRRSRHARPRELGGAGGAAAGALPRDVPVLGEEGRRIASRRGARARARIRSARGRLPAGYRSRRSSSSCDSE
jgi:SAM-dependent methyltransferase/tetratricopeptide (TPR) repeat protein